MNTANHPHILQRAPYSMVLNAIRIITGLALFIEGIAFIQNSELLYDIISNSRILGFAFILEHHVAFTLLAGGMLIMLGLITRIAVLFQLPVFVGVLFNPHATHGLYAVYGNISFSVIILILLVLILIFGAGTFSADYIMRINKTD